MEEGAERGRDELKEALGGSRNGIIKEGKLTSYRDADQLQAP